MFLTKFKINIFHLMYFFMPLALVTGPALPDLLLFFFSILSIFILITKKQKFDIKFESWMIFNNTMGLVCIYKFFCN